MNNVGFKDSEVQWLGEIPQHWEVVPIRAIFQSRNEDNKALKYTQILSLVKDIGIIPYEDKGAMGNKAKDNLSGYKIARKNDFILNKMNAVIGSLGVSNYDGLVSPIYLILYIVNPKSLISFYSYLFQSKTLQKSFKQVAYGIMEIRESIDFLDFKNIKIPLPPLDEQRRIAEFLDKKCEKIAEFIDKKQQIISLLKEQKLALINESTCGRIHAHNDNQTHLKFKHSGIEWLGEIPQHWEIRKLKQIANFDKGLNITKENLKDNGIFVLSYGEIHSKYPFEVNPQIHQLKCVDENYLNTNLNSLLRKGDFVFADTSEDIIGSGNFSFLNSEIPTFAGYHTIICRIHNVDCHESANADSRNDKHSAPSLRVSETNAAIHKINAKFLAYEFESSIFRSQIQKNVNGVKVYSITQNILKDCAVWLPPLDEQRRIAEFLDKKCEKIDKAIALIEQEIQAIKEYKTSLIDKAVRGGINV